MDIRSKIETGAAERPLVGPRTWVSRLPAMLVCVTGLAGCSVYDSSLVSTNERLPASSGGAGVGSTSAGGAAAAGAQNTGGGGASASMSGTAGEPGVGGDSSGGSAGSDAGLAGMPNGGADGGALGGGGASSGAGSAGMAAVAGGGAGGGITMQELAAGKAVTASSQQAGNDAAFGNDTDDTTRWCAVSNAFPQWWRVDLGASHALSSVAIRFEHPERTYSYLIETSQDDAVYTQRATVNGTGVVQSVDLPPAVSARFVRVTVTSAVPLVDTNGVSHPTWASFFEFSLFGS